MNGEKGHIHASLISKNKNKGCVKLVQSPRADITRTDHEFLRYHTICFRCREIQPHNFRKCSKELSGVTAKYLGLGVMEIEGLNDNKFLIFI